ncbi:aldo/keto reductase [Conyzicola nivalis]|uniref:Oxidoreductase n=1 Tax=Conyzicola nivalis TaxID=1477021 RepID=A0A916S9R9_9MICO|nr:aldo/keto reductase [Conyzicola nivalis]GGA90998.1 oxidoreductase [Conyzicola nivalis]
MAANLAPTVLLNTGFSMPRTGFGTWPLRGDDCASAVVSAIDAGYRSIDTAAAYHNEDGVGLGLKNSGLAREELFVTTKLRGQSQGGGRAREALLTSLDKLGLDYVDLYLIHWPNPSVDLYVEAYAELLELADEGLIRSVGVSNFKQEHLKKIVDATGIEPAVDQIQVSPTIGRKALVADIQRSSTVVVAWSPLERNSGVLQSPTLTTIADRLKVSTGQVALRWLVERDIVPIPHSGNPERQKQNADIFDFELSKSDMTAIDALDSDAEGELDSATHIEM